MTRPETAARAFLEALSQEVRAGVEVVLSPLIGIRFCGALPGLTQYEGLIFTSANGVAAFSAAGGVFDGPCICVGDSTAQAAEDAKLTARSVNGDADRLVAHLLKTGTKGPLLHIRGAHARGEVAARLTAGGVPTQEAVLYSQEYLSLNPAATAALSQDRVILVPLFSPRTVRRFVESVEPSKRIRVLAISDAVAAEIPAGTVGTCQVAAMSNRQAMVAGVEAMIRNGSLA